MFYIDLFKVINLIQQEIYSFEKFDEIIHYHLQINNFI